MSNRSRRQKETFVSGAWNFRQKELSRRNRPTEGHLALSGQRPQARRVTLLRPLQSAAQEKFYAQLLPLPARHRVRPRDRFPEIGLSSSADGYDHDLALTGGRSSRLKNADSTSTQAKIVNDTPYPRVISKRNPKKGGPIAERPWDMRRPRPRTVPRERRPK